MAKLPSHFKTALSNIEPSDDASNAKVAHEEVSKVLKTDSWLKQTLGIKPILIGSYARDVSIRRVKDVDVFARLTEADQELRPGKVLDRFEEVLIDGFDEDRVDRQHRSIKVDFPDFDLSVDVVPARPYGEHWQIPQKTGDDTKASWVETNPTKMTDLKVEANSQFLLKNSDPKTGVYVPVVKLMRQIRRNWIEDQPGGFYFEVLTYWAFQDLQPDKETVAEYLAAILGKVSELIETAAEDGLKDPTLDDRLISTKATDSELSAAVDRISEATDVADEALAEDDTCKSVKLWRELLGTTRGTVDEEDVFPLPSYCNSDGSTKASATLTVGSRTVPAGSDRYA